MIAAELQRHIQHEEQRFTASRSAWGAAVKKLRNVNIPEQNSCVLRKKGTTYMKMSFDLFEDKCFLVNRDILFNKEDARLCKDGDIVRLLHGKNSGKLARITLEKQANFR